MPRRVRAAVDCFRRDTKGHIYEYEDAGSLEYFLHERAALTMEWRGG